MTRAVKEWWGKTDNTQCPPRVKRRILERENWLCYKTKVDLRHGAKFQFDHIVAIINGGENRESNIAPLLDIPHKEKTRQDVAEKSKVAAMVTHHYGLENKSGRQLPGVRTDAFKLAVGGGTKPRAKAPSRHAELPKPKLYDDIQEGR